MRASGMRRPGVGFVVVAGLAVFATVGVVWVAIPHSGTNLITGCYNKSDGVLRV